MKPFDKIVCLPDLLRGTRAFPEACFDLAREPILQGCGVDIGYSPEVRTRKSAWTDGGFDPDEFRRLAGMDSESAEARKALWAALYHAVPSRAADYLFAFISEDTLLLTCEIPPWLRDACRDRGIHYVDLRLSPLRFGRDFYVCVRSSDADIGRRVAEFAVATEEIRMEAAMLAANVRMHQRELQDYGRYHFDDLNGALLFVGQTPLDASLLGPEGRSLRCSDFADRLRLLCQGRRFLYKGHPLATEFAEEERAQLERITGQAAAPCPLNAYQILSTHDDVELVGISSGMLQEAPWFGKTAHVLFRPFVPVDVPGNPEAPGAPADCEGYQQVHFQTFLAPAFWCQSITPGRPLPRPVAALTPVPHHHGREIFNQYWDYAKVMIWQRNLWMEGFERSGGGLLRQRIEALEQGAARGQ
ncbi:hypothetical protein [Acidovorax sp.]|uniref:hypothetical protein n=1 Tax=Acidovorax sp. TaxID=1872122 RepID=UPI00391A964E